MKASYEKISVIGLGYVGLPMAAVMASRGVEVLGVDIDEKLVALINEGHLGIVEPDLDIMVHGAVSAGKLKAGTTPEAAEVFIIAVPTPFKDDHEPDLSFVESASRALAPVLEKGNLIILESTSPVGTTEQVAKWLAGIRSDLTFPHQAGEDADIQVAHSPERVLPGQVLLELVQNDRVVGGMTRRCAERAGEFYSSFIQGKCLLTDAPTAELVKLMENSYRDVNIAFANEISLVCDKLGIDVWEAVKLANHHPRVKILNPGPGVGGHCIAVDPWFIVNSAPEQTRIIRTAREINSYMPSQVVAKALEASKGKKSPRIACLGLSYKADIDDLRESPAVEIVAGLAGKKDVEIKVVEPHVDGLPDDLAGFSNISFCSLDEAVDWADVIVLLADHKQFRDMDQKRLSTKAVVDTRGIWK
ncbi:MAG: UDP-N-acetyl-D-mannosamine dehydrogenase [Rhodospirillales bacterium]